MVRWEAETRWRGYYDSLPSLERDRLIVKWTKQGYSQKRIAVTLGLTQQGVSKALRRISEGRPGRDPRE
jgi:predicted transcriptional regulator